MTAAAHERRQPRDAAAGRSLGKRPAGGALGVGPGPRGGEATTFEEMLQRAQARLDAYRQRRIAELVASGTPEARLECAAYRAAAAVSPGVEFCSDGLVERLARRLGASAHDEIDAATPGPASLDEVGCRAVAVRDLDPHATATRQRRIEMWEEVERSALLDRSTATGRAAQAKSWAAELDAVERSWADDEAEAGEGESVRARRGQKLKGYFHTPETKDALWEAFSVVAATPAAAAMGFAQRGADWVMPARARMTTEFCDLLWKELTPHLRRAAPDLLKNNFRRQVSDNMRKWFMQADGITLSRAGRWRRKQQGGL